MTLASALRERGHDPCLECKENNCQLRMDGVKNYSILRDKTIKRKGRMADCLIFHRGSNFNLVVCELKSSNLNQKIVVEQIQGGVKHALSILQSMQDTIQLHKPPKIILVVLSKTRKPSSTAALRKTKIFADGRSFGILARPCGSKFSDIINITA